jgi:ATP adenylyltransferase
MEHENLWAPWRWSYIKKLGPPPHEPQQPPAKDTPTGGECFLCAAAACDTADDTARPRLVLVRDDRGVILLNRYPYTNGHLLVSPLQHVAGLGDLSSSQRAALMELTVVAQQLLDDAINPQGLNIGINLGRCAGAGVPGHLHVHIVPRWNGDTNFMQVIGDVRVIPQALEDSYERLRATLGRTAPLKE